jgi:hypothetical protein
VNFVYISCIVVPGAYRCTDFSRWIGQKISVFGTHCAIVDGRATVHLQLDPTLANTIWDTIDGLGPRVCYSILVYKIIQIY